MIANPIAAPQLANWTDTLQRSLLRQMIRVVSQPGIISFAGGLPDPALFPAAEYGQALQQVLANPKSLQYGPPSAALKQHIVQLMAQRGVACTPDEIFITTGAQQGLDILTRLLLDPGQAVLLESLIYSGAHQVLTPHQPELLPLSTDLQHGMAVDEVAAYLAAGHRPAYAYAIPEGHNPLGVSMSAARRQQLVALAARYGVPIIEDDPYGLLNYEDGGQRPLRALNANWVFYLGSFSKILAPALRLGWLVVPPALVEKLQIIKESRDLETSALTQRAVAAYLDAGHFPAHLQRLREVYGRRRDAMLAALSHHFPAAARWTVPQAGMFIWVELPPAVDTAVLLETAVRDAQVAFIPGHAFALQPGTGQNCLRLNFTNATEATIETGIERLADILKSEIRD